MQTDPLANCCGVLQATSSSTKHESDWNTSDWELESSWGHRKGQGSVAEEGWGSSCEGDLTSGLAPKTAAAPLEGTRLASEYNWECVATAQKPDPFSSLAAKPVADSQVRTSVNSPFYPPPLPLSFHFSQGFDPEETEWVMSSGG